MRARPVLYAILLSFVLLAACGEAAPTEPPTAGPTLPPTVASETEEEKATSEVVIQTRAPEPTATPGPIAREVDRRFGRAGITKWLGVDRADWINLAISLLIVAIGYLIGTWVIHGALPPVVRRTPSTFDDRLLKTVGPDLRWLVVILVLHFATIRLDFLGVGLKRSLTDIFFVLGLAIAFRMTWKLIDFTGTWYRERLEDTGRLEELDPIIILLVRLARLTALGVGPGLHACYEDDDAVPTGVAPAGDS